MKELSPDDRPREKLLQHGAAALGDNELVALILGSGRPRKSARGAEMRAPGRLARAVLHRADTMDARRWRRLVRQCKLPDNDIYAG